MRAKRFLAAEHVEHVEDPGRGRPAGQRRAERLRHLAELDGQSPRRRSGRRPQAPPASRARRLEPRQQAPRASSRPAHRAASPPARRGRAAAWRRGKAALSRSSTRVLARSFRPGMARSSLRQPSRADARGKLGAIRKLRHERLEPADDLGVRRRPEIMPVQIFELGEVEARGRAADRVEIEPADHLFGRHDLVVAMAPAEPHEIIAQAPPADSPWRDRPRRRARHDAWRAWRRPARGSAAHGRRPASPSPCAL